MISKKICMVGDFSVGKTSLIRRFVDDQFSDNYLSTVGVKISKKIITLEDNAVQLLVWDIEGSTKYKAIAPSYLQGSGGVLIVADVTRPETVENLSQHIQLFLSVNPKGWIVIALNKADLLEENKVAKLLQLNQFSEQSQVIAVYPSSAKTGQHVDEIFSKLASQMTI
jgi:small GTP-binding protein